MHVIDSSGGLKTTPQERRFIGCRCVPGSNQVLTTSVWTNILFGGADVFDTDGFHDPSSNSHRITIPTGLGGYYLFESHLGFGSSGTGMRFSAFNFNTDTPAGNVVGYHSAQPITGSGTIFSNCLIYYMAAGEFMSVAGFQSSGGNLSLEATWTNFSCTYLGT